MAFDPVPAIARELALPAAGVAAVLRLMEEGGTVPFIARYRKEATGGLDEVQIRTIGERKEYLSALEDRRDAILASLAELGKLSPELERQVRAAGTKAELEDLYLPHRPKRRTRATIARERGLEPLAERILAQPAAGHPDQEARGFVSPEKGVADVAAALAGARDICAERVAERPAARAYLRETMLRAGQVQSRVVPAKRAERTKFEQYYDHQEPVAQIPSHRFLALVRGEAEGVLKVELAVDRPRALHELERLAQVAARSPFAGELRAAVEDAFDRLLGPSVESDVREQLKERSDGAAVEIFASNLRDLLLAAPLGVRPVIGVDPGLRTGCKCAVLDATGKFLETVTFHLSQGDKAEERAKAILLALVEKHRPHAIGVGNGTGGRETEGFIRRTLLDAGRAEVVVVSVNEAGASVYSASDLAREEHPELDVTVRGAISIGRRLQDPLAELVKIEPRSIGVGQYQHDVDQKLLSRKLDDVVETCVNKVGVEANSASAALLGYVAGIGPKLAKRIVQHREAHGPFASRKAVLEVPGLGPKTFEQAAGFLRVRESKNPLDHSAVHPERYPLVQRMAQDLGVELTKLVGNVELATRIPVQRYVGEGVGAPTLQDILAELQKPGRDPRASFEPPRFREDVHTLEDLQAGMELEGVVTNVTAFGAFVDVGVHQDGLVHISQLADRFVKDPHEVVKAGDKLKVRVLEVDLPRRRISLTARSGSPVPKASGGAPREERRPPPPVPKATSDGGKELRHNPFSALKKR